MACILGMHGLFPCLPLLSKQCNITYLTILFLKIMCGCFFLCVYVCMILCAPYMCRCLRKPGDSPGAEELTDNCELPDMAVEN